MRKTNMTKKSLEKRVKELEEKVRRLEPLPCTCSPYDLNSDPDCPYHAGQRGGLARLAEMEVAEWG